ncbi:hypothetical protein J3R30DRAFT_3693669 [Lentinula aciculospora]|uniref:Uncharacterized protein n=1 Tax=Lentinula aciculospora TaxID=153920 RepID=A0A9W9AW84_9AGAR|nr:hypothetical protein J3R30DRAFT_3693669 [Lentinula aciculospora]
MSIAAEDIEPPRYTPREQIAQPTTSAENAPPEYSITYTFSTLSDNSMLLLPPPASPETRPRYHISISQNCFTPMSWVTIVRRGSAADGEVLGEFELGIPMGGLGSIEKRPTVFMHGRGQDEGEKWLEDIYNDSYAHHVTWQLPPGRGHLYWDILRSHKKCYCSNSPRPHPLLAEFIPQSLTSNSRLRPSPRSSLSHSYQPYQLKVYPSGFGYLDDILLSALVYERKRTTPCFQTKPLVTAVKTKYDPSVASSSVSTRSSVRTSTSSSNSVRALGLPTSESEASIHYL